MDVDFDFIADIRLISFEEGRRRIPRRIRDRSNPFELFDEDEFRRRFRFRKESVHHIVNTVYVSNETTNRRGAPLPIIFQLLVFLRFLATGSFLMTIGDLFGIHKATVSRIVHRFARVFASKRSDFIKFSSGSELRKVKREFFNLAGFPGVVGALDCTHIRIIRPSGNTAELYRNRKGYFSINVQMVCDANLMITSIVSRWPGSTHDARIFNSSALSMKFENNEVDGLLLGDNGYPNLSYLLTPLLHPRNPSERRYNSSHKKARNTIERCFGCFKKRFPVLHYGMRMRPTRSVTIIIAAAILYNWSLRLHDTEDFDDEFVNDVVPLPALHFDFETDNVRQALITDHFS